MQVHVYVPGPGGGDAIEQQWIEWARATPSDSDPGAMMYLGETNLSNGGLTQQAAASRADDTVAA